MTPNARFIEFLQDIEPSTTTVSNASSSHQALREHLRNHETFKKKHVETFLAGSYQRDTAIRPRTENGVTARPDVDIFVVTNHTADESPDSVLDLLEEAVKEGYSDVKRQRRSLCVITAGADMDVVPLIAAALGEGFLIPDCDLQAWVATNPPKHTEWTTQINDRAGGRFKPLTKIMKWWRRLHSTTGKHPKGFVLECIAAECMDFQETHYGLLFVKTLEGIISKYQPWMTLNQVPVVFDPGVPGSSLTRDISYQDFRSFYDLVQKHAEIARRALYEENTDEMTRLWRVVLGPRFPATKDATTEGLLAAPVSAPSLIFPDHAVKPNKPAGFA
jgi:SMODS domain-containing protein